MTALATAGPALADLRKPLQIENIEAFPVRYPTVMRFKFFEGPSSGPGRPAIIIKITASDGTVGWGQSVPIPRWSYETPEGALDAINKYIRPVLIGVNPFDLEHVHALMNLEIASSFTTGAPITKAGIDIALHDLIGHASGLNIAELWGRTTPEALTLSWTLNPATPEEIPDLLDAGVDAGYEHFNIKVAPDTDFDLELAKAVRKWAPDAFLWADANGGYDLSTALEMAPKLADAGVDVLEQPIPAQSITGYQQLRRQGALPILMDEGIVDPSLLLELIKLGCLDGVAMKPARCGGLLSAAQQLRIIEDSGLLFLGSGLTDPDISLAASLILYGAFNLQYPAALNGPQFLGAHILKQPLEVKEGKIAIPKGPGLGIEVDEEKLRALIEEGMRKQQEEEASKEAAQQQAARQEAARQEQEAKQEAQQKAEEQPEGN